MRRVGGYRADLVVIVAGLPVADVAPHRAETRKRAFVPVREASMALARTAEERASWQEDLAAAEGLFPADEPGDPCVAAASDAPPRRGARVRRSAQARPGRGAA